MNLIVAVDQNWGIGKNGQLLTKISGDMKFFKETTMGKVVVMGRRTFESIPSKKALPGRTNIILTKNKKYNAPGCQIVTSKEELCDVVLSYNKEDVFLIGGENIYKDCLEYCDTLYITKIYDTFEADRHMVNIDSSDGFNITWESEIMEENGVKYQFFKYERKLHV
ncbi:MAG TPA: dihydrofolate reductase [Anaerovoracaceae bacterium]|nr:dihydrofolate reductase [Anaerovoracaceae bacterium]